MTSITERAVTEPEPDSPDLLKPDFLKHLRGLNLNTVAEYRQWCAKNGFSLRIQKHWRERLRERAWAGRRVAETRLARTKFELRRPERIIEAIRCGDLVEADFSQPYLIEICRQANSADDQTRSAFFALLRPAVERADFFRNSSVIEYLGEQPGNTFVAGLAAVARQSQHWIRRPDLWSPRTHNSRRQFTSLLQHCFARWPVPTFMESAWFVNEPETAAQQQRWYLHLARGESIRTADLPLTYTRRMVHHFLRAPDHLAIDAALRWGQVLALGGTDSLAKAIVASRIGTNFEHDEFWITFIRFFVENPGLHPINVGPLSDFIYHQKFATAQGENAEGEIELQPPPRPEFSMQGRTPDSLRQAMLEWHRSLRVVDLPHAEWNRSTISPLQFIEATATDDPCEWQTVELLTSAELVDEGRAMQHCVATYVRSCVNQNSTIWSLRRIRNGRSQRVLTVEISPRRRRIVQAKGRNNAPPKPKHLEVLKQWAAQASLNLAEWIASS